jgi:hypothetical protein
VKKKRAPAEAPVRRGLANPHMTSMLIRSARSSKSLSGVRILQPALILS